MVFTLLLHTLIKGYLKNKYRVPINKYNFSSKEGGMLLKKCSWLKAVLWIRNYLFRIRIQIQLSIFRVPDPGNSSGSMRNRIQIQPVFFR